MLRDREELIEHLEWLLDEGEPERAWLLCKKALRRFPKDAHLWFYLGDSLLDSGRYVAADKAFKRSMELRPTWAFSAAKRAEAHLMLGHLERASNFALQAHDQDRDLAHASYIRAIVLELEGKEDVAHFFYRRAHRLNSDEYFPPHRTTRRQFKREMAVAIQHLKDANVSLASIEETRWLLLERPDPRIPELADVPLLACSHLVTAEIVEDGEDELGLCLVETGFIFRKNVERLCRTFDDVYTQIYVSILDELDSLSESDP